MNILNIEIYNDHIREVKDYSLTSHSLEELLKGFKYTGEKRKVEQEVEDLLLPPFATSFYDYIFNNNLIPSPNQFTEYYLKADNFSLVSYGKVKVEYEGKTTIVSLEGLMGRVLRTYPSLIRDFHFYLKAYESGFFSAVHYSLENDYKNKIDIRVQYNNQWFNVGLLLNSKRSLFYKTKKLFRHKPVDVIYIELDREDADWVGDYMLYTQKHLDYLLKEIKKKTK